MNLVLPYRGWQARGHRNAVILRPYAQKIFRGSEPVPGRRTGQPAVLALARTECILTGHHLAIDIRLHLVQCLVLDECRGNLAIMLPRIIPAACKHLSHNHPRIVVAENAGILLISLRVGGNLTVILYVLREGRIIQNYTLLSIKHFLYTVKCLVAHSTVGSDAGHRTPALALDEYFRLVILLRAHFPTKVVVSPQEPFPVPAIFLHGLLHRLNPGQHLGRILSNAVQQLCKVLSHNHIESGNHKRLSLGTFRLVLCCLERFVRVIREAVQVQAVVPVGTTDKWQSVRAEIVPGECKTDSEMLQKGLLATRNIVERHHLIQNREVPGLLEIGKCTEKKPERVVIETSANTVVAPLCQWLILVIAAPVRELCGGNVEDAFTGSFRYLVNEADEILVGIPEAHSASDSALEE